MPANLPNAPPPEVVAKWPRPNYIDPVTRNWLPGYAIAIHLIATSLVILRFTVRFRKESGGLGLDDALLLPAWLCATGFVGLASEASIHGSIDRHLWDVPPEKWEITVLTVWIAMLVFIVGTCCLKLSVLLFSRRLQKGTFSRNWKWAVNIALAFTMAYSIVLVMIVVLNCTPTQAYWKLWDPTWRESNNFSCINTTVVNELAGVFSIISDMYAILLANVMLHNLAMSRKHKLGLSAIFGVSLVAVGAGIGRTVEFADLSKGYDLTWLSFWVYFWSIMEFELGIICACLPTLRFFIRNRSKGRSRGGHHTLGSVAYTLSTRGTNNSNIPMMNPNRMRRDYDHDDLSSALGTYRPCTVTQMPEKESS